MRKKEGHDQKEQQGKWKAHIGAENMNSSYLSIYSTGSKTQGPIPLSPMIPGSGLWRSRGHRQLSPTALQSPQLLQLQSHHPGLSSCPEDLGTELLWPIPTSRPPFLCSSINVILGPRTSEAGKHPAAHICAQSIRHPEYDQQTNLNDIMLLQVPSTSCSCSPAQLAFSQHGGSILSWGQGG